MKLSRILKDFAKKEFVIGSITVDETIEKTVCKIFYTKKAGNTERHYITKTYSSFEFDMVAERVEKVCLNNYKELIQYQEVYTAYYADFYVNMYTTDIHHKIVESHK